MNVISWNSHNKYLLASGDDKGEFKIWDLRQIDTTKVNQEIEPFTRIKWHSQAITSISFEPREDAVLAVASADNKLTLWDFSVIVDEGEQSTEMNGLQIPAQLMFLHQG